MSNPKVRPHLHFYAEDNGTSVNEYYQASHWRERCSQTEGFPQITLTPMVTIGTQQYFLYEPCVLRDGQVCMPCEWFQRSGHFYAMVWSLRPTADSSGWIVEEFNLFEVPEDMFLLSFTSWHSSEVTTGLPDAQKIQGETSKTLQ